MIKTIQAITLSQIIWSIVVLIPVFLLFRYWIRKKNKDMKKQEQKEKEAEKDFLLSMDETDRIYDEEIPEDYYLKY